MTPAEVFSLYGRCDSHDFHTLTGVYWEAEAIVADENFASYSWLIDRTPYDRQCRLCGTVCHTDEYGRIPNNCDNAQCAEIRTFWAIHSFPRCENFSYRRPRSEFLRNRMGQHFGASKLSQIPDLIRFDFLLAAMIERIAHESSRRRND